MILREDYEKREKEFLSPFAVRAAESAGRVREETPCQVRTAFQRDRDRIVHAKAFRRLMHKTQVFLSPEGDHFRTRLTHTIEVSQIARTISRGLALNEDLTEAIALGHDLGHTPFGHSGETILNEIHPGGFAHNLQSLRVVDYIEGDKGENGCGLNLTQEVRNGIACHTGTDWPRTLEGCVVRFSDRIAYINHDIDDALRSGVIREADLPADCIAVLGADHRTRINTLVMDIIEQSSDGPQVCQSPEKATYMNKLRTYMFQNVYRNPRIKRAEDMARAREILVFLYGYFRAAPQKLPEEFQMLAGRFGAPEAVKDYIACMSDTYAAELYQKIK